MVRYADSAKPFLDDLLGATATGRRALDLSQPEIEAVCRILLDMPDDVGTWRQSALQILPHFRRDAQVLLNQDLHGSNLEKMYRATRWLADLAAIDPAFDAQGSTAAATPPRLNPASPAAAAAIPDDPMACVVPLPGLVGWWSGDSNENDIVGGNNPSAVVAVSIVPGEVRSGFTFGTEGYIEIPQSASLENQQFTWLAWVRPDGPGPNAHSLIINQNIDGSHASVGLAWRPLDQRFAFLSGDITTESIVSADTFPPGAFYLVGATYDGTTFQLRVNGILEGSLSESKKIPYSSYSWQIGAGAPRFFRNGSANTWNGVIDEVQAYSRALSAAEILSIFQAGNAGVCKDAAAGGGLSAAGDPLRKLDPPRTAPSTAAHSGVILTPFDPAKVDDSFASTSGTVALVDFVNRSSRAVDIYWIDYQGNRVLYYAGLAPGASWLEQTSLNHPWLVVVSGTGGTPTQDTGTRLAGFEAVTPNVSRDPAKRDTAIITDSVTTAGSNQIPTPAGAGAMGADGAYRVGNGVYAPALIYKVEPEYCGPARKLKAEGVVLLYIVVQTDGAAHDFKVLRSMGYGLDEKAIEAVRKWRFKPGMKDGNAVPVEAQIEVYFPLGPEKGSEWYSGPLAFASVAGLAPPVVKDGTMPESAREISNESAVLEFTVDSRGSVKNIHPIYGSDSASELLAPYLGTWKFQPAVKGNQSVEATGRVRFVKGQGDEAAKLPLTPPLPQNNPMPPAGAASNARAREKKVKDQGEFEIYKQVLQDTDPMKQIQDLDTWTRRYPNSDYKNDDRPYLYLMAYQRAKKFDKVLEKAKELMGQNLEVLFPNAQQVRSILLSAMGALRSIENPSPDQFDIARRASEQLEAYSRKQGSVSDAASQVPSPATSTTPADTGQIRTMVNPTDGQNYVWIPPGSFTMGCSPGDTECAGDEKPPHAERIAKGFWLGQTEVTQAAYQLVTGGNPSNHKGDQFPVESLTWDHASNYCRAIGGRLPTEVEWEYAARAGSTWARYGSLDEVAWHSGNSGGATHPVATKQPNAFGLYDMLGNVWEYVTGSYPGSLDKILRGGAPFVDLRNTRASARGRSAPSGWAIGRGFRCAGEWPGSENSSPSAPPVAVKQKPTLIPPGAPHDLMFNKQDGQSYFWIPPGAFTMGCSQGDSECEGNERPPHAETIANGFWLGQTEVTQAAYQRVIKSNPSHNKGDRLPVESVTWKDALSYCNAIGGHLPTEIEWEYAARGQGA
ncbi:MAG TPA: TonB family protein [Candidatus Acidoferrales bacterium]|nr:TonB family protein [Candidatus Acidoferrales bacterium]